jgi:hypothetical protein
MPQCTLLALSGHSALWHRIFFSELAVTLLRRCSKRARALYPWWAASATASTGRVCRVLSEAR